MGERQSIQLIQKENQSHLSQTGSATHLHIMKTSQAIAILIFFLIFFGALWFFYSNGKELSYVETIDTFDKSRFKLEPLVRSEIVNSTCKWPIGEYEELSRTNKVAPCSKIYKELAELTDSKLYIHVVDGLRCTMADLLPSTGEEDYTLGIEAEVPIDMEFTVSSLMFLVKCSIEEKNVYEKAFVNFIQEENEQKNSSVSILAFDNLRHSDFRILFPRTWRFMEKKQFVTSQMYHKTDNYSFIEKILTETSKEGCKMQVSLAKKADFAASLSPFYAFLSKKTDKNGCLQGGNSLCEELLSLWSSSSSTGYCLTAVSMDPYAANSRRLDTQLSEILLNLEANGAFKNTTIILITNEKDESSDFPFSSTPFFSIRMSDSMKKKQGGAHFNLRQNAFRLTTSKDVYGTIRDVIRNNLTIENGDSSLERTLFFDFSSLNDTCEDVGIPVEKCICMQKNEELSHKIDNGTTILDNLYGFIESEVLRIPCVQNISIDWKGYEYQWVYETLQLDKKGEPVRRIVEFGIKYENKKTDRSNLIGRAAVHILLLLDGSFRMFRPPIRLTSNHICYASTLEETCILCHQDPHLII